MLFLWLAFQSQPIFSGINTIWAVILILLLVCGGLIILLSTKKKDIYETESKNVSSLKELLTTTEKERDRYKLERDNLAEDLEGVRAELKVWQGIDMNRILDFSKKGMDAEIKGLEVELRVAQRELAQAKDAAMRKDRPV